MENYIFIGVFLLVCILLFFLFKTPKQKPKTKAQKQEELIASYKQKLHTQLSKYSQNPSLKSQKKVELLKNFAQELRFNIFFNDDEVREIIEYLAQEEV